MSTQTHQIQDAEQVPALLTAEELAEVLRVHPVTIRNWSRRGTIPSVKIGRRAVRYRLTDVLASGGAR